MPVVVPNEEILEFNRSISLLRPVSRIHHCCRRWHLIADKPHVPVLL